MSVLNQSGDEQVECPLCMEPLEVDDLNFFPCTCGYQICRFCWHRIRTDENGLCPACRKAYSENPADFTPLSKEQVAQLKAEKRQRDQQRKAKLSESRKHLANVRVVQKNLVFVVGLPLRLADAEVLKRHEYFGKFGKIHKVVINQSTSYAGSQGPSASAYVTYMKSDDALRAIQSVNNITIDGRLIKSSLGTTKYCSHFMKNQACPKPDCMYLHDFGDPEASFTKEQMHAGKHQEYEKKLHEVLLQRLAQAQSEAKQNVKNKENTSNGGGGGGNNNNNISNGSSKETWPQLNQEKMERIEKRTTDKTDNSKEKAKGKNKTKVECKKPEKSKNSESACKVIQVVKQEKMNEVKKEVKDCENSDNMPKLQMLDDNTSFFSLNNFQKLLPEQQQSDDDLSEHGHGVQVLNDSLPDINSTEDWEAAFGFTKGLEHRNSMKDTLETFGNNYSASEHGFSRPENYQGNGYDISKFQENILDVLSNKGFSQNAPTYKNEDRLHNHFANKDLVNGFNGLNFSAINGSIDQQMSKFFNDFYKNGQKDLFSDQQTGLNQSGLNGLSMPNGISQNGVNTNGYLHSLADRQNLWLLQRRQFERQFEEQLLNMKHPTYNHLQQQQQNGLHSHYINGETLLTPQNFGPLYQNSPMKQIGKQNTRPHAEDELDFDPFHETQKALAELIENEQNHKLNSGRTSVPNGLIHTPSTSSHMPPPPPGFLQPNTHMNSFGSKILPYLNMANSQQPQQQQHVGQNWSGNYGQLQQHKGGMGAVNDWKVLDPAIVSSSRHFPLANMPPIREQFNPVQPLNGQQLQNGPTRSYDYQNFSNYSQQIQPNYNSISHFNGQPNINWLGGDLNSQISSPPGFRSNSQAAKQQEC